MVTVVLVVVGNGGGGGEMSGDRNGCSGWGWRGKSDRGCSGGRKINDGSNVGRRRSGSSGGSCW